MIMNKAVETLAQMMIANLRIVYLTKGILTILKMIVTERRIRTYLLVKVPKLREKII